MSNYAPYIRFPRKQRSNQSGGQRGGGGSDWMNSANAIYIQPGTLTEMTRKYINDAPMFHPLEPNHRIPTPSTGIYPVGIYYMNQAAQKQCKSLGECQVPDRQGSSGQENLKAELMKTMTE